MEWLMKITEDGVTWPEAFMVVGVVATLCAMAVLVAWAITR